MKLTIITIKTNDDYDTWKDAQSEYISFVPQNHNLPEKYFEQLLDVFSDRPLFRKLSMVSPSLEINGESPVFGWLVSTTSTLPSRIKSSSEPYAAQIGYLPGAIIKKSALERLQHEFTGAALLDSINLSAQLWNAGHRIFVHPKLFMPGFHEQGLPLHYRPELDEKVTKIWKREMVG